MKIENFAKIFYLFCKSKMIKPDQDMMTAWYELLKAYPDDKIEKTFMQMIRNTDGFPNIGKMLEIIEDRPNIDFKSRDMFSYVLSVIRKKDWNAYIKMPDECKDLVDYLGGWNHIKNQPLERIMYLESSVVKYAAGIISNKIKEDNKKVIAAECKRVIG